MEANCDANFDLVDLGWLDMSITVGPQIIKLEVSSLASGPVELVIALIAFFTLGISQSIRFELEPGNPIMRLDWVSGYRYGSLVGMIRLRIGEGVPMPGGDHELSSEDIDIDFTSDSFVLGTALIDGLIDLIERYGPDGVNRRWGNGLPAPQMQDHHLDLLKDLKMRHSLYRR